jgi:Ca2+-binding RTX toxin-like protein
LAGGADADQLFGDTGVDTADYSAAKAGVVASLNLGGLAGEASGDTYSSVENLTGSAFNDNLQGDSAANLLAAGGGADVLGGLGGDDILKGGAGDDFLQGGAGADTLDGGTGVDTASYRDSGSIGVQVSLSPGEAAFNGDAQGDVLVSVENLEGSGLGSDALSGNDGANVLEGRGGFDTLLGGGGNDILRGGADADTLDGGAGVDTASYSDSTRGVDVNLSAGPAGGFANDGDTLSGIENVEGSELHDVLQGGEGGGANVLDGRGGADTLIGQGGRDVLTGGSGADTFLYRATGDSLPGAGRDRVADFSHAQLDKLSLFETDANAGVAGDQAFSFVGQAAFSAAGQVRFFLEGDHTVVELNTAGASGAEAQIELAGDVNLAAGDFFL